MASEHISKVQKLTKSIELMLKTVLAGAGYASGQMEVLLGRRLIARGKRGSADLPALEEPRQINQQTGTLTLPGQSSHPRPSSNPNGPAILVVEPQAAARAVTRMALEHEGYQVFEAEDGGSAVRFLSQAICHLVLQNLVLPDMDGFGLGQWLSTLPERRSVPIVAMSDSSSLLEQARSRTGSFCGFLVRPSLPSYLLQSVYAYFPALRSPEGMPSHLWRNRADSFQKNAGSYPGHPTCRRRILLVEANEFRCSQLAGTLGGIGFNVTSIPNGWEALNEAKVHQPDLVISDPLVPGLDGFGLCWEMRKDLQLASIPIILSPLAAATEVDIDLAHALGAAGYISRTPNLEPLSACLKMVFTKNQQAEHVSNASTLPLGKSRGGCWVSTG